MHILIIMYTYLVTMKKAGIEKIKKTRLKKTIKNIIPIWSLTPVKIMSFKFNQQNIEGEMGALVESWITLYLFFHLNILSTTDQLCSYLFFAPTGALGVKILDQCMSVCLSGNWDLEWSKRFLDWVYSFRGEIKEHLIKVMKVFKKILSILACYNVPRP